MERIRQGSGIRATRILLFVMLFVAVAAAGCRKEIPEDKARVIFAEVAVELVKRPDAGDAAKSAMIDAICEKSSFVRKDLDYLLKTRPEAQIWLEEALKAEIERDLDDQLQQWEKRITKARLKNEKNVTDLDTDQAAKFEKIEQETARKKAALDAEFEAREAKLKAQVEALKKDLEK